MLAARNGSPGATETPRAAGAPGAAPAPRRDGRAPSRASPHGRDREPTPPSARQPDAASPDWQRPADPSSTLSPGRLGISDGATTMHWWPSTDNWRWMPYPHGPAS